MTLNDAIKQRIPRMRNPIWANPNAYLRMPLLSNNNCGPWMELYDDVTQEHVLEIRPGSQHVMAMGEHMYLDDFEIYDGPVSPHEQNAESFARTYAES
jgi:hypothetical protein